MTGTARTTRTAAVVVSAAAVLAAGVVAGMPPASAATVDTSASYVVVNRHSGKAMDLYDWSTAENAPVNQWTRNDLAVQQWQFVDAGGGFYKVRSRHSGKVLELPNGGDGTQLVQSTDRSSATQQFRLQDSAGGFVRFVNRQWGKVVDVWQWSTADGGRLAGYADLDGANQQWQLIRLGGGTPTTPAPTTPAPTTPAPAYPQPGRVTGDIGVHDPTVVKRPDGTYLVAHTGDGIALKTSADRIAFRNAGAVFPGGAPWTTTYTGGARNLWAPDLSYRNGRYHLYYSASTFGSNRSAIFLATSTTGNSGSWTHEGLVVESRTTDDFNAIDPNLTVDDQGRWWLTFGSFWSGIKMIPIDPATGRRLGTAMYALANYGPGIEAPVLVKRGAWYYLYVSFDRCCQGAASTYRIMVGRSASPTGPFVDRAGRDMLAGGGTQILASHGSVHGPGHQAVLADTDGDVLFYHYYAENGASLLGVNRIGYDAAAWPYVY
ncbi:family 43 glycosylhydrolase [Micromonospora aurantiaca]|uniref:Family 43 glycosylhydrolase n=1 Tax=Micromonospora aurantiaca (nom. illeg.) TaxID=47850 RepID=A0ABQ6UF13_9ACTN|nr:family 43 glycosylhydrolase [Micromonospora aurantiaca]KAB1110919.1 family 43 glycosylhydrolase [Micromonospora aurantiaca]UFN96953.1 family 43 glycosylhydrolase [Micromonospora aurantiaca]